MNNNIIIILLFLFSTISFGQKKELKLAEKSIKSEDYSAAKQNILSAEKLINEMDAKTTIKFHYLKGLANYANGNSTLEEASIALENLNKVIDLESNSSNKLYTSKADELRIAMLNKFVDDSKNNLDNQDYKGAYLNLEMSYRISPADTLYLYNAALIATENSDFDIALSFYNELIDIGFTGITTNYYAIEKATGEEQAFQNPDQRSLFIKAGTHENPRDADMESVEIDVLRSMAAIYKNNKDYENAIIYLEKAKTIDDNDINIILLESNIRWEMGEVDNYEKLITKALEIDPNNVDLYFNLGVISSDKGDVDLAMSYYDKAIETDKLYKKAYLNAAALILQKESKIIEEMNSLGTSNADYNRYDELKIEREDLYKSAVPYLVSVYELDNKNISAVRTLRNIYSAIDDMDNYNKYKAIAAEIESGLD